MSDTVRYFMADHTYPTPETVEAVWQQLPAWLKKETPTAWLSGILAAARRVEQEEATTRFSREWDEGAGRWNILDAETNLTAFGQVINEELECLGSPNHHRALAAYVEVQDWTPPLDK
jgi:hypothetical protein